MLHTLRSIFSLLLSYALLLLANGLFGTLLGIRTKLEGFPTAVVGVIAAGYFVGLLIGAFYAVRVVAAVGHIRAFAAFASMMSVSALLHVLWVDPIVWIFIRAIAGFCMAGMILVTESWLNERARNEMRGRVMSAYMLTNYFAAGCGQFLLPLADPAEFQLFSVASIIFSLALVPVLLTRATAPKPVAPERMNFRALWRVSPLGLVGAFSAGIVNATFYGLAPVFAHGVGLTLTETSTFMAAVIFGGLLLQWPVGRLSDRIDRRWVLTGVALATSIACINIYLAAGHGLYWLLPTGQGDYWVLPTGRGRYWLFTAAVLYGGLSFTVYSLAAAHTNDFADPEKPIQTASGLLVAYGSGACMGPLVAGSLMEYFGPPAMFLYSALVTFLLASFGFYRMYRRAPMAKERQSRIITLPGGQFTAGQLYTAMREQVARSDAAAPSEEHEESTD